ncbi:hypothetical protein, partial [Flavobacterium subsaxonicum]
FLVNQHRIFGEGLEVRPIYSSKYKTRIVAPMPLQLANFNYICRLITTFTGKPRVRDSIWAPCAANSPACSDSERTRPTKLIYEEDEAY